MLKCFNFKWIQAVRLSDITLEADKVDNKKGGIKQSEANKQELTPLLEVNCLMVPLSGAEDTRGEDPDPKAEARDPHPCQLANPPRNTAVAHFNWEPHQWSP